MEKRLKKLIVCVAALVFSSFLFAQEVPSQVDQIRIQLMADLDAFPGSFESDEQTLEVFSDPINRKDSSLSDDAYEVFSYSINRIRELATYLMEGMLSGWEYDYVPSDKTRNVAEFFELTSISPFNPEKNHITYHNPTSDEGKLQVWAWCDRTEDQKMLYKQWSSIVYPKVHGSGKGEVSKGNEGVKEAIWDAVKNGVREYWRQYEKNKPKEIVGKIFVIGWPRIYVTKGHYNVELDFFMETDRMSKYLYY